MNSAVEQVLDSFDALSEQEKQQTAVEVLKRIDQIAPGAIPDATFVEAGEVLFQQLDAEEATDGEPNSEEG